MAEDREDATEWINTCADQIVAGRYPNMGVSVSLHGEYTDSFDILPPNCFPVVLGAPMTYSLTWLPQVLRAAGLKVEETPGWETRGHGDIGKVQGVLCHHTSTPASRPGDMPTLQVLIDGNGETDGPLSQLGLGRGGTYYLVCAGKGWHAGTSELGGVKGISDGNSHLIGIEAENPGDGSAPWPAVQMDAYRLGVAAILKHIGATSDYAIAHKEWTPARRDDPNFDMNAFRRGVAALMGEQPPEREIGLGDSGSDVSEAQQRLGIAVTGMFDVATDAATRAYQASRGLRVDGIIGAQTWAALRSGKPALPTGSFPYSSKGSWYSQYDGKYRWRDSGDAPGSAALGVPDDAQGVAMPSRATLGKWFEVRAPNGVISIEQQTDLGPAAFTGRTIDIAAAAAERFGYSPQNFPTDSIFSWRPVEPPAVVAGLSPVLQAIRFRDLRNEPVIIPPPPKPGNPMPDPNPTPFNAAVEDAITAIRPALVKLAGTSGPRQPTADEIRQFLLGTLGGTTPALPPPVVLPPGTPNTSTPAPPPTTTTPSPSSGWTNPSVMVGAGGLSIGTLLQILGALPPPVDMTTGTVNTGGLLTTVLPLLTMVLGSTGAFGSIGTVLMNLFGLTKKS